MNTSPNDKNINLLPCSPVPLLDPAQYEELVGINYLTRFGNDEIRVLYLNESWKFESWGGGPGDQARLSLLHGSRVKLNNTGYKNPTMKKCRFFRKLALGMFLIKS